MTLLTVSLQLFQATGAKMLGLLSPRDTGIAALALLSQPRTRETEAGPRPDCADHIRRGLAGERKDRLELK